MKRGKNYRVALEKIEPGRLYTPLAATRILKELPSKFDQTVEVAMRLGVDPRKADQMIRGTVMLPHGIGKEVRVLVFAQGDKAQEAMDAGADFVGAQDMVEKIQGGWFDFDAAVAAPDMMSNVGKLGKLLGPKGLMPNPKAGTVTFDIGKAVKDIKAGKLEYRVDRQGNLHLPIGKLSFDEKQLVENYAALLEEVIRAKPAAAKGRYLITLTLSSTMSPGIRIDPTVTRNFLAEEEVAV
jgi:large subunit ribosomal protein L1